MFIAQASKYTQSFWKYLVIPILFFGLMALNYVAVEFLEIDMNQFMQEEIARKGANRVLAENLSAFVLFLGGLLFWVKYIHRQPIRALTTSRKKVDWGRFGFAFILVAVVNTIIIVADYYSNPNDYLYNFRPEPFLYLVIISVLLIPLQTSFEEYFFRGYLMQGLGLLGKNRWVPLILTSVIFGGLHYFNPEVTKLGNIIMIYYIGTGFMLGIITLMDEGLELALGFHAANNLITALLVTADWTAFQTDSILKDVSEPSAGWDVLIPIFVIYPVFLFILAKKYGWKNWKNKLFGKVVPSNT
ncbi:CPBP family intramembrane glutamic endopeptidase [Zunongwangia sp. F363]|uniref:CPBP family intramembrane glutamic endopeptidase n=1 Tax=Autumnicola tepida TaxID=3075595 RepID=A0ABU3C9D2_9FLAO|nr:CPBP family intramembrane glutamic endopeptidase [Zunongwangia sp. F363]MDT0642939.1 CPBP family intramembrane glutamic endopeptidase [Zunongwangia sp. F363]